MESYHGLILTPRDAMILLEAARVGIIPKTTRRLSEFERSRLIQNGAIFIWDELESGMKRWTDGKSWSASRVSGSFLIYKEMENTKSFTFYNNQQMNPNLSSTTSATMTTTNSNTNSNTTTSEDSYRYKNNGLIKQSFSITLNNNLKLHLISYVNHNYLKKNYSDQHIEQFDLLKRPTEDPIFGNLKFDPSLYPETILTYQDTMTDFQQVDNSLRMDPSLSSSPTNSIPQQRQQQQQQQQQQPSRFHAQHLQQQQLQQPPLPPHQQQLQQPNYRIHSVLTNELTSSPRLLNLQNANHIPPLYQQFNGSLPPSSIPQFQLQSQLQPQQLRSGSFSSLQQQPLQSLHPLQQHPQQIQQQQQLQQQKINMPMHHKEDGRYLNLLDRTFSS